MNSSRAATGSSGLGRVGVCGRSREPTPATGITAHRSGTTRLHPTRERGGEGEREKRNPSHPLPQYHL